MFYLAATILTNTILFALFKLFPKYGINPLQAIVVNYLTCVVIGCIVLRGIPIFGESMQQQWWPWALLMGTLFIALFNLIAIRTRIDGITTTSIANKISLVIPVVFSYFLYQESIGIGKISGFLLAFPAIYFASHANKELTHPRSAFWPVVLFLGSGLMDTLVKYVEHHFLASPRSQQEFVIYVFGTASTIGILLITLLTLMKKMTLELRNLVAGILLGVPNYFSIYFLIKFLRSGFLQSSAAIPVNNIGIVLLSGITAIFLFREKPTWQRLVGLFLSVAAILLISLSDLYGGK